MSTLPFAVEVAACRVAQIPWANLAVRERLQPVRELRRLIVDHTDAINAAIAVDIGRPAVEVLVSELLPTTAALKFVEQTAARLLRPRKIASRYRPTWLLGCRDVVHRRPWGVVGIIGTWNYPFYLNAVQAAQALAAGNGVVWKPSENAPRTAELMHRLFLDAGFPAALFQRLPATREGGAMMAEADCDHVVFTGSDGVGRKLAARLGERLVPSTLELSGCDAMFVLDDADVKLAAHAAWFGVTLNRGQTCIAVRRIFVHRSRYAEFVEVLRPLCDAASAMTLVTPGQGEQAGRLIAEALQHGATALAQPNPQTGITPTFMVDATPEMRICREASFAPIAAVIPFDSIDTALSVAANCSFALAASVFTADTRRGAELASRIPAGSVTVNDVLAPTAHPATPFGGRGASGWGVTQGAEGLVAMTVPQTVTVRTGKFRPHVDESVEPDPAATYDVLLGLMRATHGRGWRSWVGGVRQLIRGIRRKK